MNYITFELMDSAQQKYKKDIKLATSKLEINDSFVLPLCEEYGITTLTYFSINVGSNNMAIIVRDYTLTPIICIQSFYDIDSQISMLQSINVDIAVIGQRIKHLQADCKNILITNSSVDKMEIGIFNRFKPEGRDEDIELLKMDSVKLWDSEIKALDLFAECGRIEIQGSHVTEMMFYSGLFRKTATTDLFHIWYNTTIDQLTVSNTIKKLKLDTSKISRIYAHSTLCIDDLEMKDAIVESCYGFRKACFQTHSYDTWSWISKSAQNALDTQLRADATYEMMKCSHKNGKKADVFFGKLFDFCAGYGYKPIRIIRTSGIIILINIFITY